MIRETTKGDRDLLLDIHRAAFGQEDEAALTAALLDDPTAQPALSLLSDEDAHVLFTRVIASGAPGLSARILCPLAVRPAAQGKGIGTALVKRGLDHLRNAGCDIVFVLGDPAYYGRFGFMPVGDRGFDAPFPLSAEYMAGWQMVVLSELEELHGAGPVTRADSLMQARYWVA